MARRPADFESAASASSAIPANIYYVNTALARTFSVAKILVPICLFATHHRKKNRCAQNLGRRNAQNIFREDDKIGKFAWCQGAADIFIEARVSAVTSVVAKRSFDRDSARRVPASRRRAL